MNDKVHLQLSVDEMCQLTEMCAMTLSLLEPLDKELSYDARYHAWTKLAKDILDAATQVPSMAHFLEYNRVLGGYFFTPPYIEGSFYAPLLLRINDNIFWSELVKQLSDRVFREPITSPKEAQQRAIYEHGLWLELKRNGLGRFKITLE